MNDWFAQQIIHHLVESGVRHFSLSLGSRSTPLTYALFGQKGIEKMVHFDERGAAFYAYGYAKASQKPVALIVTSGTAVGNLFPAIMEAAEERVPLIVITADRPPELRACGANQSSDQGKFFGTYVKAYYEIPCFDSAIPKGYIGSTIAQAVYQTNRSPKGVVHLNCPFREPFLSEKRAKREDSTFYEASFSTLSPLTLQKWAKKISSYSDGIILIGSLTTTRPLGPIYAFAERIGWPILADISSGIRGAGQMIIPYYEYLIEMGNSLKPKCILHLGDRLSSKRLLEWIEDLLPELYLMVADHPYRHDPSHILSHRIETDPALFCEQLLPLIESKPFCWFQKWKNRANRIENWIDDYIPTHSEPGLIRFLHHHLPPHFALFFGNSMPVRDAEVLFFPSLPRGPLFTKRGAAGIDGNIATVVGLAEGSGSPILAILGDLAALHDLNSLAQIKKSRFPIIVLIINNQGGGIFSFLPIARNPEFVEEYLSGAHNWDFESAAQMFHLPYASITQMEELGQLISQERSMLIEFKSDRASNYALHQAIKKILEKI